MNQPLSSMSSISIIVFWFIQVIHNNVVHSFSPCLRSTRHHHHHHHHHHHQNHHQQCNENIIKYNDVTTSIFATSSTTDDNQTTSSSSSSSTSTSTSTVDKSSSSSSSNNNKNNGGMTALHFIGEKVYKSDPIPIMHNHHHDLCSFFAKDEFRYLLFNSNDDASTIRLLPNKQVDETIMNLWCKQCQIVGGEPPDMIDNNNDVVFLVNTGGINFSGLKIKSNSYIGVKYLKPEDREGYSDVVDHGDDAVVVVDDNDNNSNLSKPQYQLVFIKDSQYAEGPRLLVWIYNQLTGRNNNNNSDNDQQSSEKEQSVHAFSKFTFEITPDGKSLVFVVESKLEVIVKFPALLLKVLPVSKDKAEQQGSASVLKAMSTDIEAVLPKIRDSYRQTFGNVL